MIIYTAKEIAQKTGYTIQHINNLRTGYSKLYNNKSYTYAPILREHEDYFYKHTNVYYTEQALKKIQERRNGL